MCLFHLLSDCRLLYPVSKQEEAQYYWLTTDTDKQKEIHS
jgi:ribosomal protein S6